MERDFPVYDAIIAPYMADLTNQDEGHIMYGETRDDDVLERATDDVRRSYPSAGEGFEARSVFTATWKNVKGFTLEGTVSRKYF